MVDIKKTTTVKLTQEEVKQAILDWCKQIQGGELDFNDETVIELSGGYNSTAGSQKMHYFSAEVIS